MSATTPRRSPLEDLLDEWKGQDQTADMELGGAGAAPVFVGARLRRYVVVTRVPGDAK